MTSDEFWIRDRKRSSLMRSVASASAFCSISLSFCSMMAPAIRMTKRSMNAPNTVMVVDWARVSSDGSQPRVRLNWPTAIAARLQKAVVRHTRDPPRATFSNAMNAYAPQRTGPQPVR